MNAFDEIIKSITAQFNLPLDSIPQWSPPEQEQIYANAYASYAAGLYAESSDVFTHLILNDPFIEKYWRGLASSRQMEKEYQAALHAWCISALLKDEDPLPHFHAAECLLSLRDFSEALKALESAEIRAKKKVQFSALLSKISVLKKIPGLKQI